MIKFNYFFTIFLFIGISTTSIAQSWKQIGADIDGEAAYDESGISVSLCSDASVLAIGAYKNDGNGSNSGHVRIYQNNAQTWTQIGADIDGEAEDDRFGCSVSLSSDGLILAAGAFRNDGNGMTSGHVRIFENNSGTWTQIGDDIDGEAADDNSGIAISLNSDATIVAIGASWNDGNGDAAGHVRIFENNSGTWTQVGVDIDGEAVGDRFGKSVSISSDGSIVAIGAPKNDGSGDDAGTVKVYQNNAGTWIQIGDNIDGGTANDYSGWSVSLSSDGSTVAIGAPNNDAGSVSIYENNDGTWTQIGEDINGEAAGDNSGKAISLSSNGSIIAIGAMYNNGSGNDAGSVRIYENNSGTWTQIGADIDGEAAYDRSGYAINLSSDGSSVAIGAYENDENGTDAGHARVFNCPTPTITTQPQSFENVILGTDVTFLVETEESDLAFQWRKDEIYLTDGGNINGTLTNELTITSVSNNDAGTYDCIVTDCREIISDDAVLSIFVGINDLSKNGILIYPNPTNERFNIECVDNNIRKIIISDIIGKTIINKTTIHQKEAIDLSGYESGIYLIHIQTDEGMFISKIIKR